MRVRLNRKLLLLVLLGLVIIGVARYLITENGAFLGQRTYHLTNPPSPLSIAWSWVRLDFQLHITNETAAQAEGKLDYVSNATRFAVVDVVFGATALGQPQSVNHWEGWLVLGQQVTLDAWMNIPPHGSYDSYQVGFIVKFQDGNGVGLGYYLKVASGRIVSVTDGNGNPLTIAVLAERPEKHVSSRIACLGYIHFQIELDK